MGQKLTITVDGKTFAAKLNETETAKEIAEMAPFGAEPSFWGEEIYFDIPKILEKDEKLTEEVEAKASTPP